uniref:Uncharacterized protein n=1 Tax=Polytomella parva TaxID=51329 RepID=A0A7S0UU10_9CHLO
MNSRDPVLMDPHGHPVISNDLGAMTNAENETAVSPSDGLEEMVGNDENAKSEIVTDINVRGQLSSELRPMDLALKSGTTRNMTNGTATPSLAGKRRVESRIGSTVSVTSNLPTTSNINSNMNSNSSSNSSTTNNNATNNNYASSSPISNIAMSPDNSKSNTLNHLNSVKDSPGSGKAKRRNEKPFKDKNRRGSLLGNGIDTDDEDGFSGFAVLSKSFNEDMAGFTAAVRRESDASYCRTPVNDEEGLSGTVMVNVHSLRQKTNGRESFLGQANRSNSTGAEPDLMQNTT